MKTYEIARVGADMLIDPKRCILQCEQQLSARLEEAAAQCLRASRRDPVLLLSGPSGAGKTTATPMSRTRVLLYQSPEQSVEQMLALQAERNSAIRFFVIGEK